MPTYEYRCTGCGRHIEVQQSFSDAPLETCAVCRARLRRVFSPVGVLFKGAGFYSTDARSSAEKSEKRPNGDKPADKAGTDGGAAASDAKKPSGEGSASPSRAKATEKPA